MAYVAALLIIGLCLYLVVQPFFQKEKKWRTTEIKDYLDELSKEHIFATLNELEMEYNMGKLPEADYGRLKGFYENLAAKKIKEEAISQEEKTEKRVEGHSVEGQVFDEELEYEINKELRELKKRRKEKG
ncbi:hypothetical protein [Evansella clarkii]|uniref:hypothetical protein n=1 Tax=Evansella clarkii TaxID=79879 RepID=UPI000B435316|nr:hypothetical protein [Evansella clarkii]